MVGLTNAFKPVTSTKATPKGNAGYDNPRENIDPHVKTQAFSTKEITLSDGSAAGYVMNDAAGVLSGGNALTITADNSTADQAYVPMVLYNTDATPPAASGFPVGTLYVQYTA